MANKQIIILDRLDLPSDNSFRYALWAAVPVSRQSFYANATAVSAWSGASTAENTAIQAGQIVEKVDHFSAPAGTTIAQIQAILIAAWNVWQNHITNENPWSRYGTFFDGTTWTAAGVA